MTREQPHPHPQRCDTCKVRKKQCGLKPETCSKTYPISDREIEFILQMNENLPTDEMELQVRDMLVMEVRERTSHSSAVEPALNIRTACCYLCGNLPERSDPFCAKCKDRLWQVEHDERIRADERAKVLKEVYVELITTHLIRGDCVRDAIKVIESLRSKP